MTRKYLKPNDSDGGAIKDLVKGEADGGLVFTANETAEGIVSIGLAIDGMDRDDDHYQHLLRVRVSDVFGVSSLELATEGFSKCLQVFANSERSTNRQEITKERLDEIGETVLDQFKAYRPRDVIELQLCTKLIILNYMSNRELIGAVSGLYVETRSDELNRGVKLTRLFLETEARLSKRRSPGQHISVTHNHIQNKGQAIIGSNLTLGDGNSDN